MLVGVNLFRVRERKREGGRETLREKENDRKMVKEKRETKGYTERDKNRWFKPSFRK